MKLVMENWRGFLSESNSTPEQKIIRMIMMGNPETTNQALELAGELKNASFFIHNKL